MLLAGADKVAVNTAALESPCLLTAASARFGSQCVVLAADVRRVPGGWTVLSHAGTRPTGLNALEWFEEAEKLGAGELLVTSVDSDGTQAGYDLDLYRAIASTTGLPVVASGAGRPEHFVTCWRRALTPRSPPRSSTRKRCASAN
jgi:cyclase